VQLPDDPAPLFDAVPVAGTIHTDDLPLAMRITSDRIQAMDTAERMRTFGAKVVVVEQWDEHGLFCHTHTGRIASEHCHRCGEPVCRACTLTAGGVPTCKRHLAIRDQKRTWVRTRQWAAALVFAVFLYKVVEYITDDYKQVQAASVVEVGVFQLVPQAHQYDTLIRGINGLPSKEPYEGPTLKQMQQWFDDEHERYTGRGQYLRLRVHGPWTDESSPPELFGDDDNALQLAWNALNYTRYWRDLARARGVKPGDYPVELYVRYSAGSGDDLASHSRGSEKQRLAIAHVDLNERNPTYAVLTIAHELAHALGAEDLYTVDATARFPEGYVEPFRDPLYPQRFAELMAVDIPTSRYGEREAKSLEEARVGFHSAALMGWVEPSRAEYFYSPPVEQPLEDVLTPPPADEAEDDLSP
jgi:hypothetical protein